MFKICSQQLQGTLQQHLETHQIVEHFMGLDQHMC